MKKLSLFVLVALLWSYPGYSQPIVHTDELLELSGIVWRLADAQEYAKNQVVEPYAKAIDAYFGKYKSHPLIASIRTLRQPPYEVGYNGVATSTMLLTLRRGRITLNPAINIERYTAEFDPRWDRPALERYVRLLDDFYRESRFRTFYEANQPLYNRAVEKLDSLLKPLDTKWFESFFGKPFGNPKVYVCLSYGYNNYALQSQFMELIGQQEYGIIVGCTQTGKDKTPDFNAIDFGVVLHEFGHNFANPIVKQYAERMADAGKVIFPYVQDRLARAGYGSSDSMIGEGLNELFRLMYFVEVYGCTPYFDVYSNDERGFIWLQRALRFMDNFYANRQLYPTIADFMPELVGFIHTTADNISTILLEFEHRHPYVTQVYPAQNQDVPIDITAIRIQFSQPMFTEITGIAPSGKMDCKMPPFKRLYWSDATSYVVEIDGRLEPATTYGLVIPSEICVAKPSGQRLTEDCVITFKTAAK